MAPKKFVSIFGLIVALALVAGVYFTYFENRKYYDSEQPAVVISPRNAGGTPSGKNADVQKNPYSPEEYSLPRGETGEFKGVDVEKNEIIVSVGGNDYRAIITPSTEIFRLGLRAALADIQNTDVIGVFGREKTKNSGTFVADSIYANSNASDSTSVQFSDIGTGKKP
jgi:hypothetical protein